MEIRKIQKSDAKNYLDFLLNLDQETNQMMFDPGERPTDISIVEGIINNSVDGNNLVLVAINEDKIVGFLSALRSFPKRVHHTAYIITGIRKSFRGQGIGSNLFIELDRWANDNNITRLELSVISSNIIAKNLYQKFGFEIEGIKKNSMIIEGNYIDELYMAKLF